MPIDYKNYPKNWLSEIRPAILERANHCCDFCSVPNYSHIIRGEYEGEEAYEDSNADVYLYPSRDFVGNIDKDGCYIDHSEDAKAIKIVLTIMHLNHDITDNRPDNLRAGCQKCHNIYDAPYRAKNRKKNKIRNQLSIF